MAGRSMVSSSHKKQSNNKRWSGLFRPKDGKHRKMSESERTEPVSELDQLSDHFEEKAKQLDSPSVGSDTEEECSCTGPEDEGAVDSSQQSANDSPPSETPASENTPEESVSPQSAAKSKADSYSKESLAMAGMIARLDALQIQQQLYGHGHPDVMLSLKYLGNAHRRRGEFRQAEMVDDMIRSKYTKRSRSKA